jgi:hypothetical protein
MFRSNDHHQGAHCLYFAKVIIIKLIVNGTSSAVWLHIYPVLIGVCTVHCVA